MNDSGDVPAKGLKRNWYDPEGWPRWLRWVLTGPLSLLVAILIFFVYRIVNGFASEIPSAVTGLFAVLVGSYIYVVAGRIISPSFSRLVGYTFACTALTFAAYDIGALFTSGNETEPLWYGVLFALVAAGGATAGAFADVDHPNRQNEREFYAWLPEVLRWLLFLPVALVLCTAAALSLGVPLGILGVNTDAIKLVNTPFSMVVFVSVAAAVAPRGKGVVGITLASICALFAILEIVSALNHDLVTNIVAKLVHANPADFHPSMSVWYQLISGLSLLVGAVIGAMGSVEAERMRKQHLQP